MSACKGKVETSKRRKPKRLEVKPKVVKLPSLFVVDWSKPFGSLTGPRLLVSLKEGKVWPMDLLANQWTRQNKIPIFEPTKQVKAKLAKLKPQTSPLSAEGLTKLLEKA